MLLGWSGNTYICGLQMKNTLIYILFLSMLLVACDEPDCVSELDSTIQISLYKFLENEPDTVFMSQLRVLGEDSILITNRANVSRVTIPANPGADSVTCIFTTLEYGVDTLVITYTNGARLISEDCGYELIFSNLGYSRNDFDSLRVINPILFEASNEDIRVYNN